MDRDAPHDDGISEDEFSYYYSAYEDYIRDAFAGFCDPDDVQSVDFNMEEAEWYWQNSEGETDGPATMDDLKKMYPGDGVTDETNVWCEEIDSWRQVGSIVGLSAALL
jgi:hypothetical protein